MDRPVKRKRIALESLGTDDEDELDCEPNELNQRRDPAHQLEQARARASDKLKSRFESIFAKYEKDFTGIGDEIDLRTGKVVVNNGHLQSITDVQEFGQGGEDEQVDAHCSEKDPPVHGISNEAFGNGFVAPADPRMVVQPYSHMPLPAASMGGILRLPSMMPSAQQAFLPSSQPFGLWEMGRTQLVDPAWQTPELPQSAFMSTRFVQQAQQRTFGTGKITRVTRGPLMTTKGQDGDEEDVLLGAPDNLLGAAESPLIKSKFPAVGSSPNNDPCLHEMIKDITENIAATSPSAEQSRKRASGTGKSPKPSRTSASSDADKHCKQGKKKTSESYIRSTEKPTEVSPTRRKAAPRYSNKERVRAATRRKRRQPDAPAEQRTADPKEGQDASDMEGEEYLEITGKTPLKPAGQSFYVEIKARRVDQSDSFAQDHGDHELETVDGSNLGVDASDQTLGPSLRSRPLGVEKPAEPPRGSCAVELVTNRLGPEMTKPGTRGALSHRKTIGPASASTCEDSQSTTEQNRAPALTEFGSQALQEPQPSVPHRQSAEQFERNFVDPSYAFSDEENLLPRRKSTTIHKSEPESPAGLVVQGDSRVGKNEKAGRVLPTTVALDTSVQVTRNRATRTSPQLLVGQDVAASATEASTQSQEQSPGHLIYDSPSVKPKSLSKSSSHRRNRKKWPEEPGSEQPRQQFTTEAEPRLLRGRQQNKPSNDLQGPPGLRQELSPVVASLPAVAKDKTTSAKPSKTAESAPVAPSTPRPKCKSRSEKPGASRPGLNSLLSDDDDDEDEISFHLADFTPSGHHRILALRPDANPPSTPSAGKNMRAASSLFGHASYSKANKHSTPGRDQNNRKKRRNSPNNVTGTVVEVRRDSPRAPSPATSVVQTPGGTRRRCGEDGFRCERNICFFCISI